MLKPSAETKRKKWNQRYQKTAEASPAEILQDDYLHSAGLQLPSAGKALDFACGRGGSALYLARLGWQVEAWDISDTALQELQQEAEEQGLSVNCKQLDLESSTLPSEQRFDLILVRHFLYRDNCPALAQLLNPGGLLFYQTFYNHPERKHGPQSSDFVLSPQELPQLFDSLHTLHHYDCDELHKPLLGQSFLVAER